MAGLAWALGWVKKKKKKTDHAIAQLFKVLPQRVNSSACYLLVRGTCLPAPVSEKKVPEEESN